MEQIGTRARARVCFGRNKKRADRPATTRPICKSEMELFSDFIFEEKKKPGELTPSFSCIFSWEDTSEHAVHEDEIRFGFD